MRVLVLLAHPSPRSFAAALAREVVEALSGRGHSVGFHDLYAEKFDPVLSIEAYRHYVEAPANKKSVEAYADALTTAEGLVVVHPVWHDGPPAILKGFYDRVFLRGVVFEIDAQGVFYPILQNIRCLGGVALYGASRERTRKVGDLPRRFFKHNLGDLVAPDARRDYLAAYDMDHADDAARTAFAGKVRRAFRKW